MFDDRFIVGSPGGLHGNLKKEDMLSQQFSRNPRVTRVLAELEYIREMGEGLDRMFREMKESGLPKPEIQVNANHLTLTLKNAEFGKFPKEEKVSEIEISLNERQKKALEYIKAKGKITNREYRNINNVGRVSSLKELTDMVTKGVLKPVGKGRSLRYLVSD